MSDAYNTLDSTLSGETGSATAYTGQVYLGKKEVPAAKGIIRGQKIDTGKQYGDETLSIAQAKAKYLTDAQLREKWNATLRKNGFGTDPLQARALWEISIAGASDWYATSNGQQKVTPEQYLTWYAGGKKKAPALPTRQVYQVTEDEIAADIDEIMLKKSGRTIQDSDKQMGWYQDLVKGISKLYSEGIVTTVKEVKNPKTGKMEKVVTQTPGFSKEQIAQEITSTIEAEDPASVQRKQRIDNTKWLLSRGGKG